MALCSAAAFVVGVWAGLLWAIDIRCHRLPNALTYPGILVAVGAAVFMRPEAMLGAVAWAGLYASIRKIAGADAVGGGDVKLAVPLGVAASWPVLAGVLVAILLAQVLTVCWWLWRPRAKVAHGPCMMIGVAAAWALSL